MTYKYILALDPSGAYTEGKGTTGWCVFFCVDNCIMRSGNISARTFDTKEAYWQAHVKLIQDMQERYKKDLVIVMEDYILYANKANSQINSRMETCKLIGLLQTTCWNLQLPCIMQLAATVKKRWTNEILHYKGYICIKKRLWAVPKTGDEINRHCLDSIRHAVHYATFKNGAETNGR